VAYAGPGLLIASFSIRICAKSGSLQKVTKIARQAVDPPGVKMLCYAVDLHGIIHTHNRNSPVEGQGFF